MTTWIALYAEQPGWAWLGVAAVLLCLELVTGSGYLLWPSASAAVVGALAFAGWPPGIVAQAAVFAGLAVGSTYAARRWWPPRPRLAEGLDLNDSVGRLVGCEGEAVAGGGRVFVDGKEWAAESDGGAPLVAGARVRVTAVIDGARLKVRPL